MTSKFDDVISPLKMSALLWIFVGLFKISQIVIKFCQQVLSVKRSRLAKFRDDIISTDIVMTSQIIWHDVKIWWRYISVKNVGIALKFCRLFELVIAIICTNLCEFFQRRSWFTEIPSFTGVDYLWRHWRLPMAYYKSHGLKHYLELNEKDWSN